MKKMTPEELEQFIHRELRSLPPRRAPRSLEARVLAALEHQAVIPWYHKSWSYWPAAIRALFLALATGISGAIVAGFYLLASGVDTTTVAAQAAKAGQQLGVLTKAYHVVAWIAEFSAGLFNNIPALWLYGGLALVAALYATFFGLGAAAYRMLYRSNN
jgi:hypothetical protein